MAIHVAGNKKTYLACYVKNPIFSPHLNRIWNFYDRLFIKVSDNKFHEKPSGRSCTDTCEQMDRRKDGHEMPIGAFRDYVHAPEKTKYHPRFQNGLHEYICNKF